MKIVSNKRVTSRSPPPKLLSCKTNTFFPRQKNVTIECFHSRGQHLCKFFGAKESVCIRKEFNSHRTGLGHQHGRRFIVLGHQYGRRDVMWKHSIEPYIYVIISLIAREEVGRGLVLKIFWILNQPWFTQNVVVMDLVISLTQNLFLDPPLPQANSCRFLVRWYGGDITVTVWFNFIALNLAGNTCLIILIVCRLAMC